MICFAMGHICPIRLIRLIFLRGRGGMVDTLA